MIRLSRGAPLLSVLLTGAVFCARATAQPPQGQLDTSPALFAVLAAINAAGYDADLDSTANSPLRQMVRQAIAAKKLDCLDDLKRFFAMHRQRNWDAELNQYISYALVVDGPPDFHYRIPQAEVPPDAATLGGLDLVLQRFAKEANIEDLWRRAQPYYDQVIEQYHGPVSNALLQASAYLRNPTSGYLGRRFQIYIDLLGAPNQVQSRSYKDDYFIVITPSTELQTNEIRHAYLHYLLDPLALKYSENLLRKKSMIDYAQAAPALGDSYKQDYFLLATECLIKAVESRLAPSSKRGAMVDEALKEGFVMTPAFADGLVEFEKQPAALRLYYPDMVEAIDLVKEEKRLAKVEFAKSAAVHMVKSPPPPPAPEPTGVEKTLAEAEQLSARHDAPEADLEKARTMFLKSLQQTAVSSLHAKAYYGLARIAALRRDPETAQRLFEKALELNPDAETKSWSYVYLGRLAMVTEDPNRQQVAEKYYRAALAIEAAPETAKSAAKKALEQFSH